MSLGYNTELTREVIEAAMLPEGRLNAYALASCVAEILDRGILPPSIGAAQAVLEANRDFVETLNRLYPDEKGTEQVPALDTAERGWMLELLAQHFAGCSWPCIGDTTETQTKFCSAFSEALQATNWDWRFVPPA